jgi:NADH:ubiquinone oxidoreductase subunit 6 (subunit J)
MSLIIILSSNIYYSILSLLVLYSFCSFIFIFLGVEYFGLLFFILYIGAIAILFIFVIMLFDYLQIQTANFSFIKILTILITLFFGCEYFLYNGYLFNSFNITYQAALMTHTFMYWNTFFIEPLIYFSIYFFNFFFIYVFFLAILLFVILLVIVNILHFNLKKNLKQSILKKFITYYKIF